jgi:hypothetical protein
MYAEFPNATAIWNIVVRDFGVFCDDDQVVRASLRYENAVDRVGMVARQIGYRQNI